MSFKFEFPKDEVHSIVADTYISITDKNPSELTKTEFIDILTKSLYELINSYHQDAKDYERNEKSRA